MAPGRTGDNAVRDELLSSEEYSSHFPTPSWPKAHKVTVRPHHEYGGTSRFGSSSSSSSSSSSPSSSSENGAPPTKKRSVHHPGRAGWDNGRLAGMYGHEEHPDDHGYGQEKQDAQGEKIKKGFEITPEATERGLRRHKALREKYLDRREEVTQHELDELLADPGHVWNIREVKEVTIDYKKLDPRTHGYARYVLPVSEAEIKGQNYPGKEEQEKEKKEKAEKNKQQSKGQGQGEGDKEQKKEGEGEGEGGKDARAKGEKDGKDEKGAKAEEGQKKDGESKGEADAKSKSDTDTESKGDPDAKDKTEKDAGKQQPDDKVSKISPKERRFLKRLVQEMDHMSNLENNTGQTLSPLKHGEALDQLEFAISEDDQFTPDNWVPRSKSLLRLTGKNPMNAEADLAELFGAGLITPIKLHYVRNHGSVPALDWDTHQLEVYSTPSHLLSKPRSFTMDELAAMEWIDIPVVLACDGNRRQEVNMIKKSGGFGWGSSGVSCVRWKGVPVSKVLRACGLEGNGNAKSGARLWLNYEGADEPSEGKYSTCIPLAHAMDETNDVILAFGMNDRPLHPDHGYPLRSIIPGYVGGRCVKWLKKLWISDKPNTSHYHIWDNRVLPPYVDSKESEIGKALFHHPDTACNEQNLQSVIVHPANGEIIPIYPPIAKKPASDGRDQDDAKGGDADAEADGDSGDQEDDPLKRPYLVQGFAYHGSGKLVQRVELSLDGGQNWRYCFRRFPEFPLRHGEKYWTWLHWSCEVEMGELCNATELVVRAWDVFKNTQPEHITWNLLGMMNNTWYRVRPSFTTDPKTRVAALQFRHPIGSGAKVNGWMRPSESEAAKAAAEESSSKPEKVFSLEEVEKHSSEQDAWIILNNKVYDVTSVLSWHPGGAHAISMYAGKASFEVTAEYASIHDSYANSKRDECLVGALDDEGIAQMQEDAKRTTKERAESEKARAEFALKKHTWSAATLVKRQELSHDTRLYTFAFPKGRDGKPGKLGLPICKHVQIGIHMKDAMVARSYTPTRPVLPNEDDGTFDLLIKTYFANEGPFPPGGTASNYLDVMTEGEELDIRGPTGEIEYLGDGKFDIEGEVKQFKRVSLIAGGSGVTPHWQLIYAILNTPSDKTEVRLIDSNKTFEDILLYDEMRKLEESHGDQFKIWHTLSKAPQEGHWEYSVGHLDRGMMEEHIFAPDQEKRENAVFLCGPPGLIKHGALPGLKEMGYEEGTDCFGF